MRDLKYAGTWINPGAITEIKHAPNVRCNDSECSFCLEYLPQPSQLERIERKLDELLALAGKSV